MVEEGATFAVSGKKGYCLDTGREFHDVRGTYTQANTRQERIVRLKRDKEQTTRTVRTRNENECRGEEGEKPRGVITVMLHGLGFWAQG